MAKDRHIRIVHGSFGRATLHRISGPLVAHAHAEFHLIYKLGGTDAMFKIDGQETTLTDNSALLINPWSTHAKCAQEGSPSLLLALLLDPEWLGRALGVDNPAGGLRFSDTLVRMDAESVASLTALGACLARDLTDDAGAGAADCEAAVAELARRVSAHHLQQRSMNEVLACTRPLDYRIKRATEYIRIHAGENPNVDMVASAVGMSRSRLFHQFKACMGISPQQYLDWIRIGIATRLLAERHATVGDVAHQLGFSAQGHFTRFFVQHLGLSPSEFRRTGLPGGAAGD